MPRLLDVAAPIIVPEIDRFGAALANGFFRRRQQQEARERQEQQNQLRTLQVDAANLRAQRELEARNQRDQLNREARAREGQLDREFRAKQKLADLIGRDQTRQGLDLPPAGTVRTTVRDPNTDEERPRTPQEIAERRIAIAAETEKQLAARQQAAGPQTVSPALVQQAQALGIPPEDLQEIFGAIAPQAAPAAGAGTPPAGVEPPPAVVPPPAPAPVEQVPPPVSPAEEAAIRNKQMRDALNAEPAFNLPDPRTVPAVPALPFTGTLEEERSRRRQLFDVASQAAGNILGPERARKVVNGRGDPLDDITWKVAEKFIERFKGPSVETALTGTDGSIRGPEVFLSKRHGVENVRLPDGRVIGQLGDPSPEARAELAQTLQANGAAAQDASRIARNVTLGDVRLEQDALQYLVRGLLPEGATLSTVSDAEYNEALRKGQKALAAVIGDREQLVTARDAALQIRQMLAGMAQRGATPEEEELLDERRAAILENLATEWQIPERMLTRYVEQTFTD